VKYLPVLLVLLYAAPSCRATPPTSLTPQEVSDGWIALFDGKSLMGWEARNGSKWTVSDGMLAPQADRVGLLVTTSKFRNYELKAQYAARTRDFRDELDMNEGLPVLLFGCGPDGEFLPGKGARLQLPAVVSPLSLGERPRNTCWIDLRVSVCESDKTLTVKHTFQEHTFFGRSTEGSGDRVTTPRVADGHIALCGNGVVFRCIKLRRLE
jgi:hypothetical protein